MADAILTPTHPTHNAALTRFLQQNDIRFVALFRHTLEDYAQKPVLDRRAFIAALQWFVKIYIEPLCQTHPAWETEIQDALAPFQNTCLHDLPLSPVDIETLALSLAQGVRYALISFHALGYPHEAYAGFLKQLEDIF